MDIVRSSRSRSTHTEGNTAYKIKTPFPQRTHPKRDSFLKSDRFVEWVVIWYKGCTPAISVVAIQDT